MDRADMVTLIYRTMCKQNDYGHIKPPQDGGGDGKMSREGISPNHYEESFKQEVVAFTRATSRKEATEKWDTRQIWFHETSWHVFSSLQVQYLRVNNKDVAEESRRAGL